MRGTLSFDTQMIYNFHKILTCTSMTLLTFIGFSFQGKSGSKCVFSEKEKISF